MQSDGRASRCRWSLRLGRRELAAVALVCVIPVAGFTAGPEPTGAEPDFPNVLKTFAADLGAVTSDPRAVALFSSKLGPALDLRDSLSILTGRNSAIKDKEGAGKDFLGMVTREVADDAIRLTAALAAWRLAAAIKQAADTDETETLQAVLQEAPDQLRWLTAQAERPHLRRAAGLGAVLIAFPISHKASADGARLDAEYAAFLDRTYPRLTEADTSWLAIAEREGVDGLRKRLAEPTEKLPGATADGQDLAARYFEARLRPVFRARLIADAIRSEANAERQTREAWQRLHSWRDRALELKGLVRLCGTWQWTIHNHRHHQDHKVMMSFPPPYAQDTSGSRPSKIVVLGDSVYLRWEFQGGVQEDSLLFMSQGQRLEGSFVNSAGAWGSITGKRTGPCGR